MRILHLLRLLAVAAAAFAASPAQADRDPTADERSAIEAALRGLGYVSWEEIGFDDGAWEVDDARAPDGKEYDLKLRPDSWEVIDRDED